MFLSHKSLNKYPHPSSPIISMATMKKSSPTMKHMFNKCSSFGRIHEDEEEDNYYPNDVPRGHFVVYVGDNRRRYICPISWLDHPQFKCLLRKSEEEFGFKHDMGLIIPCDDALFRSLIAVFMNNHH